MNPQRLLQVQQAANPSLRAAATPASILQGGGVTPQYSVSPQGANYNPQGNQINYTAPVSAPYQLNPQVQVAAPQPLYVSNPMGNAPSVINPSGGRTGIADSGPSSSAGSVIANTGLGLLKGASGLIGGTVTAPLNLSKSFSQYFGNLGDKLAGAKPQPQQQWDNLVAPIDNAVSKATGYATGVTPLTRLGQNTGFYDVKGNPVDQAGKNAQRVGSDIVNVAALANPARDIYALGSKATLTGPTKLINLAGGAIRTVKGLFSPAERKTLEEAGIKVSEDSAGPASVVSEATAPTAPTEPPPPEPAEAPKPSPPQFTPAEAQVAKEAGIPSPAETAPAVSAPPLTPEQQQIINEFPNGLDKPAVSILKKQGFTDDLIAQFKQQVDDAHAAANPEAPKQAVKEATTKAEAPPTPTAAEAQNTKAAQETTGKVASEVPNELANLQAIPRANRTAAQSARLDKLILNGFSDVRKQFPNDKSFYDQFIVPEADKSTRSADLAQEIMGQVENDGVPHTQAIDNSIKPDLPVANDPLTRYHDARSELTSIASRNKQTQLIKQFDQISKGMSVEEKTALLERSLNDFRAKGGGLIDLGAKFDNPAPQAVPTEHYLDSTTGKSVPVDTMHPKYAKNALNKMLRDHPETEGTPLAKALEARASSSKVPTAQFSDIPTLASKEAKASKAMSLEYRANKIGQSGRNFVQTATDARVNALKYQQGLEDIAQPFHDLTPEEQSLAVDVKEGKATSDDPHTQAGVQALKDMYAVAHKGATDAGLEIGNKGDTYFNHTYPKGWFDKPANLNAAVKHLVDSGQAADKETALRMMNKYTSDGNFKPNTFGNFKTREADLPGYLKNSEAVHTYTRGAAKNISQAEQFGPNGEHLTQHLVDAINNGEDAGALKDVMNSYMHPKTPNKFTSKLQKPLNVVYLTKAAISHIPQLFANTGSEVGFSKLGKAISDTKFNAEDQQLLHDSGLQVSKGQKAGNVYDKATAPGLNPVLQKYREVSGIAGKNAANELASKGDVAGLNKMQVTGPFHTAEDGSIPLSKDQQIQAMHHMADKHIGTDDVIQSPAWTQGSIGHATSQFQRAYTFKQGERIINMVKDAAHGHPAQLARYLVVAAPIAGTTVTVAKNEIKNPGGNPLGDKGLGNFALDVAKNSGAESLLFGLPEKAINAARFNFNTDSRYQNAAGAIAPGAGIAVETGQNVDKAARGNSTPLKKQGFGMVPIGGKALSNKFVPQSSTQSFQDSTNTGPPKTIAELQARNQKVARDFAASLSPADKQSFTDNKGKFIDFNTATDAHNQGILNDDQYNHYLALAKTRDREFGNTKYQNQALDAAHAAGKIDDQQYALTKAFDQKTKDLTAEGYNNFRKLAPDFTQNAIADYINKQLPPGLSKLQANPDLAAQFAKFTKETAANAAKAPEDQETPIDYQDRTIRFWAQAAKDGAPSNVQSVYRDGGNKAAMFLKQGKATKDDINQAVGLDNMLLASGIITTPKFSRKWRADNGYPAASDFMEGGANYGTAGVGQYLSNGNNAVVATKGGKGSSGRGFGNGTTTALNDGSGIFSSVNKKTGAVTLKNVQSLNGTGMTGGVVDPDTGLFISKPTGIKQLLNTKDTTFKSPGINLPAIGKTQAAPKLKSFAAPDVRGTPRPQRAVPIRFQRAKFK